MTSRQTVSIVDARGVKVGDVFSIFTEPGSGRTRQLVVFDLNKRLFALIVHPQEFEGTGSGVPMFESNDCSGPALIDLWENQLFPLSVVSAPGRTVYLAEPDAEPLYFESLMGSELRPDGTCALRAPGAVGAVPAQPVIDLNTLFTPPFRVR